MNISSTTYSLSTASLSEEAMKVSLAAITLVAPVASAFVHIPCTFGVKKKFSTERQAHPGDRAKELRFGALENKRFPSADVLEALSP